MIVIYGATGVVGRRACAELVAAGAPFVIAGRDARALAALARELAVPARIAALDDPAALGRAFDGARVVASCAGPDAAAPILVAALAAGAHYVDCGGDQAMLHALYQRHESTARRAGLVAVPGCGVDCALGDWAAGWAAAYACGDDADAGGDVCRDRPAPRLADGAPLDDVAVSYLIDELVLSPGSQRALFARLSGRHLAWRRDRWELVAPGARHRVNPGPARGGERDALGFAAGDPITIPRHVAARAVDAYVATTRRPLAGAALRLLARALPLVPRAATELLVPYAPDVADYARTRFAIVAQARRGFSAAQVVVAGTDLVRTTAAIVAWVAQRLVGRGAGPVGMRAPSELFRAAAALREVGAVARLAIEPSFA